MFRLTVRGRGRLARAAARNFTTVERTLDVRVRGALERVVPGIKGSPVAQRILEGRLVSSSKNRKDSFLTLTPRALAGVFSMDHKELSDNLCEELGKEELLDAEVTKKGVLLTLTPSGIEQCLEEFWRGEKEVRAPKKVPAPDGAVWNYDEGGAGGGEKSLVLPPLCSPPPSSCLPCPEDVANHWSERAIMVDFCGPNMAKELHVGHLRSTVNGDALARQAEWAGARTARHSFVGDYGATMGLVSAFILRQEDRKSWVRDAREWLDSPTTNAQGTTAHFPAELMLAVADLGQFYKDARALAKEDPDFLMEARATTSEIQNPLTPENSGADTQRHRNVHAVWRGICAASLRDIDGVLSSLGVQVQNVGEAFYSPATPNVIGILKGSAAGSEEAILVKSSGAMVVPHSRVFKHREDLAKAAFDVQALAEVIESPKATDKQVEKASSALKKLKKRQKKLGSLDEDEDLPAPTMVVKSDGTVGYPAADLSALLARLQWGFTDVVVLTDSSQQQHFQEVNFIAKKAGWVKEGSNVEHIGLGMVLDPKTKGKLSSRSGDPPRLLDLVGEAVKAAKAMAEESSEKRAVIWGADSVPDPSMGGELDARSRVIGLSALKFADLLAPGGYVYDPQEMLKKTGKTSVYVNYAYVRARRILTSLGYSGENDPSIPHKVEADPAAPGSNGRGDWNSSDGMLVHRILGTPGAAGTALSKRNNAVLANQIYLLADAVNSFYQTSRVLDLTDGTPHPSRVALVATAARTLRESTRLLGVELTEEM